jgi:hypothetical protein
MADEELPDPRRRGSRWLRPLGWAAAALVGLALVVRTVDHQRDEASPPAPASTTPAVTQPLPVETSAPPLPVVGNRFGYGRRSCPPGGDGLPACALVQHVPAQVLAAVRQRFPSARTVSAYEEKLRDVGFGPGGLWYREVDARQGMHEIMIEVRRQDGAERERAVRRSHRYDSMLIVTRIGGGYLVRIQLSAPSGQFTRRALFALADDARLRATG